MATKYWIKLYHETLHDPKLARLSDNLWRRFVECLLFAGELNEHGRLPCVADMAWILQKDTELLTSELDQITRLGLLDHRIDHVLEDGYWFVVNFGKRQMPMTKAEYMQRLRDERQKEEHYLPVTNSNAESDTDKESDTDTDVSAGDVFSFYQNNIEILTPYNKEIINDWLDEFPATWVMDAMKTAIQNGVRKPNYITAILKRWKVEGKDSQRQHEPKEEKAAAVF